MKIDDFVIARGTEMDLMVLKGHVRLESLSRYAGCYELNPGYRSESMSGRNSTGSCHLTKLEKLFRLTVR